MLIKFYQFSKLTRIINGLSVMPHFLELNGFYLQFPFDGHIATQFKIFNIFNGYE